MQSASGQFGFRGAPCKDRRGGWLITEAILTLGVLGMLLGGLTVTISNVRQFNAVQLLKQQCIAAGQAELDSIAAMGQALPEQERTRLWPGSRCHIERSAGEGDWQGLTLVQVTACGTFHDREIKVSLARYTSKGEVH